MRSAGPEPPTLDQRRDTAVPTADSAGLRGVDGDRADDGVRSPGSSADRERGEGGASGRAGRVGGGELRVGPYRVVRVIGAGGMGAVFEAWDDRLGRRVAIKSIHPRHRLDARAKTRFLREARILSALEHPNICRLYDYIETAEGDYLVLEYIDGRPLAEAARDLPRSARLEIAQQVANVLVAAHAAGIVHRDLKPDNILVTGEGVAKVLDFGIARRTEDGIVADGEARLEAVGGDPHDVHGHPSTEALEVTAAGDLVGTPMYMAPEQARGAEPTPAGDIYAFGLVLAELLSGARPRVRREGDGAASLVEQAARGEWLRPKLRDRELDRLIGDLTRLVPAERPGASEAVRRLARRRRRPVRRAAWAAGALMLALGLAGAAKYTFDLESERAVAIAAQREAEDLIGFMAEELRAQLAPVGRLDVLGAVAERIIDYYAARDPATLDDAQRHKYAKGLQLIGEVQIYRNDADLASAERAFVDAARLLEALAAADPRNGGVLKSLGAAHFWIGSIAYRRGDLAGATREFEAYHDLAKRLVALDGSSAEWQLELGYAQSNLVQVYRDRGDLDASRSALDASLVTKRRVVELSPDDASARRSLANGLTYVAQDRLRAGDLDGALEAMGESIELVRAGGSAGPDAEERYRFAVAAVLRGEMLLNAGRSEAALQDFRHASEALRSLLEIEPSNGDWQRELAICQRWSGHALERLGRVAEARASLDVGRRILDELVTFAPEQVRWQVDLGWMEWELARFEKRAGNDAVAAAHARSARTLFDGIVAASAEGELRDRLAIGAAEAALFEGRIALRRNDSEQARRHAELALERLPLPERLSRDSTIAAEQLRIESLVLLGRTEEAGAAVERLGGRDRLPANLLELIGATTPALPAAGATGPQAMRPRFRGPRGRAEAQTTGLSHSILRMAATSLTTP
ncbi:MAG TPA: serine/threonine-protein kinase [Phycisphaerales bacterium]|nr:serine/threonine-protein kinase [Phycisphaerales bacterium]HMP36353.1 serine/threonine-protein kinase [Phycisphaerales bacterium]